jgi:hypothetical protein
LIKLLIVSANPRDTPPLRIERERIDIYDAIQSSEYRDQFTVENWDGITGKDFHNVLQKFKPDMLHVSTHFTKSGDSIFLDENDEANKVSIRTFVDEIKFIQGELKYVVLNGAYSQRLADLISNYVDFVVGVNGMISDEEAREFSRGFYGGLANGRSVRQSFESALSTLQNTDKYIIKSSVNFDIENFILTGSSKQDSRQVYVKKYDSIDLYPDDPTSQDLLSRSTLAEVLGRRIEKMRKQNPTASFLINLDGPWGSGKSSFLKFLKSELESKKPTWIVVDYNAWQHQRIPKPWWSLIDSIYRQTLERLRKISPINYLSIIGSETLWRAKFKRSNAFLFATPILFLLGVVILFSGIDLSNVAGFTEAGKKFAELIQQVSGTLAVIGSLITGILLLQNSLLPTAKTEPSELLKSFDDPMRRLSTHFADFTNKIAVPIAVFIDDLDRCKAEYTVEFLEGIQTIFREGSVVYVIAADRRWIQMAYEEAYQSFIGIGEPARPLGHLFLAKVFQMSIPIPTISTNLREKFLKTLLEIPNPKNDGENKKVAEQVMSEIQVHKDADSIVEWAIKRKGSPIYVQTARNVAIRKLEEPRQESETEFMLLKFHHLLEPNPRAIKRLLNIFVIYRAILIIEGIELDFEILVLWIILMMRWPIFSEYLSRHPHLVNHLSDNSLTNFPDMSQELKLLLHNNDLINVINGYGTNTKLDEKAIRQIAQL